MITSWNLWTSPSFSAFGQIQGVPDGLLPVLSDALSPMTEGSSLGGANLLTFKTPDAMLSSVESYRAGQVGFQIHAWQATLGIDTPVFTTAPGNLGHDGPDYWTGSGSLPRVVQVDGTLVAIYNPGDVQASAFPKFTHAWFPAAAFDETANVSGWTFGRKGDGYVGLYSALPTAVTTTGQYAGSEIIANGTRNVWICRVGRRAEDGSFAAFQAATAGASLVVRGAGNGAQSDVISVAYAAPGVGTIAVDWTSAPTLNGAPIPQDGFLRWDNAYVSAPQGAQAWTIRCENARLTHDRVAGVRTGDGI
jgi:hypothetical protein